MWNAELKGLKFGNIQTIFKQRDLDDILGSYLLNLLLKLLLNVFGCGIF